MAKVVFTFGRMNPPTAGHKQVLDTMCKIDADHLVFLSYTQDSKTNPLSWTERRKIINTCYPEVLVPEDSSIKTPFQALEQLCKLYDDIVFVIGDDRVEAFTLAMPKYAKEWGAKKFKIVSAGERLTESDGIKGVSASKARKYALDGNFEQFKTQMLPGLHKHTINAVYKKIRDRLRENR